MTFVNILSVLLSCLLLSSLTTHAISQDGMKVLTKGRQLLAPTTIKKIDPGKSTIMFEKPKIILCRQPNRFCVCTKIWNWFFLGHFHSKVCGKTRSALSKDLSLLEMDEIHRCITGKYKTCRGEEGCYRSLVDSCGGEVVSISRSREKNK